MITGGSGSGKNTSANEDILAEVAGKTFMHYGDPRGDNTHNVLSLLYGRYSRVLVDDLTQTEAVLPLVTIQCGESERENELHRANAMEYLNSFVEGDINDAPIKRHYADAAISFYQQLPQEIRRSVRAYEMSYLFRPKTKKYRWLLDQCKCPDLWQTFKSLSMLHESTRLQTCGAAERLIDQAWGSEIVRVRDTDEILDWEKLVKERWIVFTKGGSGVSKAATRAVITARNTEILHYMQNR